MELRHISVADSSALEALQAGSPPLPRGAVGHLLEKDGTPIGYAAWDDAGTVSALRIASAWRRKGYGRYCLKCIRRALPGVPLAVLAPAEDEETAGFLAAQGFVVSGTSSGGLIRYVPRPVESLNAVHLLQNLLTARFAGRRGLTAIDATCGNGHDTAFLARLCGESGRVLALDILPAAVANTAALLEKQSLLAHCTVRQGDHANLAALAAAFAPADIIQFNFGWLPGADHAQHSVKSSSLAALQTALALLAPGGVLTACLYSPGYGAQEEEKQAVLSWLAGLDAAQYIVVVQRFANWPETAPLPCFVVKK